MAQKPNYSFERKERARLKAEKKAQRAAAKEAARAAETSGEAAAPETPDRPLSQPTTPE